MRIITMMLSGFGIWISLFLVTFFAGYFIAKKDLEATFFASWLVSTVIAFVLLVGVLYA